MKNPIEGQEQGKIDFEVLTKETCTPGQVEDIKALFKEFSLRGREITTEQVNDFLSASGATMIVGNDGKKIIGMATIHFLKGLAGIGSELDDVVVSSSYRGRGLGEQLVRKALDIAKAGGATEIKLTSRPQRGEAGELYEKLGFKLHDTTRHYLLKFNE